MISPAAKRITAVQGLTPFLCMIALLTSGLCVALVGTGRGATAHNLEQIPITEDTFLNYDFSSEDHSRYNVDWAISLLFWNNSSVDGVKGELHHYFPHSGDPMHAYLNNGDGWQWDEDSGKKMEFCPILGSVIHYRIYAPPSDAFYNLRWGHYNIASIHFDGNECAPSVDVGPIEFEPVPHWFGKSELAEEYFAGFFEELVGQGTVREDALWFRNFQRKEKDGDHVWSNDGRATKLRMPAREEIILK